MKRSHVPKLVPQRPAQYLQKKKINEFIKKKKKAITGPWNEWEVYSVIRALWRCWGRVSKSNSAARVFLFALRKEKLPKWRDYAAPLPVSSLQGICVCMWQELQHTNLACDRGDKLPLLQDSWELMRRSQRRWGHYDQTHAERTKWTCSVGGGCCDKITEAPQPYVNIKLLVTRAATSPSKHLRLSLWRCHAASWTTCGRISESVSCWRSLFNQGRGGVRGCWRRCCSSTKHPHHRKSEPPKFSILCIFLFCLALTW